MNKNIISKITSVTLLGTMCLYTAPVFAFTKDETVYSKLNSNGESYNTIVSDHIKNTGNEKLINDISDLLNIKNLKSDENPTQDGNKLVWNANESDIYYQGEAQKELPIECKVSYELDGKEISASELAGKSGKVKIKIEYINKDAHTVNIQGRNETMYTPFVVVCGTILDNNHHRNITISNGKAIDDGSKTTVIGISMPGLKESLKINSNKIEIPDTVEIEMDSSDFELSNIVTYVTPKVIEKEDLNIFNNLDEIYNKVNTLQSSSRQIEDGANALKDGSNELNNGANKLSQGVLAAYNGANTIKTEVSKSTKALKEDTSEAIDNNTLGAIEAQAKSLATLTDAQKAAIQSQAESSVSSMFTQSYEAQIANQAKQMVAQGFNEATIRANAEAMIDYQAATIKMQADNQMDTMVASLASLGISIPDAVVVNLKLNAENNAMASAKKIAGDTAVATAKKTAEETAAQTAVATAKDTAIKTAKQVSVATAQETATTTAGKTSKTVARQVGNQAKQQFTNQVVDQMGTLGNGLSELTNGLSQLNEGSATLANGTNTLSGGVTTLAEGISKFNSEGIDKICNYINGDVKNITTRLEKLQELANKYNNFTMLNNGDKGTVKFIMIMDSIKKKEETKQDIITENKSKED